MEKENIIDLTGASMAEKKK
jgi:hypothetical protein